MLMQYHNLQKVQGFALNKFSKGPFIKDLVVTGKGGCPVRTNVIFQMWTSEPFVAKIFKFFKKYGVFAPQGAWG